MSDSKPFSAELRSFVDDEQWTFAKTMPQWPHDYLIRDRVDGDLFEALVRHIRQYGFEGKFYDRTITYFAEDGLLYWTMGAPLPETVIINRCPENESYEHRLKSGTLPEQSVSPKRKSREEAVKRTTDPP